MSSTGEGRSLLSNRLDSHTKQFLLLLMMTPRGLCRSVWNPVRYLKSCLSVGKAAESNFQQKPGLAWEI